MKLTFEEALLKLEEVVKKLEDKEVNLEDAIKLYNEGLELSKVCYEQLKQSEKLIVETKEEANIDNEER